MAVGRRLSPSSGASVRPLTPSPASATSYAACGFPALRTPARFMPRVMLTYQTGSAFNRSCFIQPPPTPPLPAEPYASAFVLAYSLRLRSCRLMGAFVISSLPPFLPETLQAAGSLRSTGVAPLPSLLQTPPSPSRLRPTSRGLRLYGLPCCRRFLGGTRRASPVARRVLCHRAVTSSPRRSDGSSQPGYGPSCCLRLSVAGSTSGNLAFSGPHPFACATAR